MVDGSGVDVELPMFTAWVRSERYEESKFRADGARWNEASLLWRIW